MSDHVGSGEHEPVISATAGRVQIDVLRHRDGSLDPRIVRKRRRRVGEIVAGAVAEGSTRGDLTAVHVGGDRVADHRLGGRPDAGMVHAATGQVYVDATALRSEMGG